MKTRKAAAKVEFVFIVDGKIVATAKTLKNAISEARKHDGAEIFERSFCQTADSLKRRKDHSEASELLLSNPNPVARVLDDVSTPVGFAIEAVIESIAPGSRMGDVMNDGFVVHGLEWQRATNEESAIWTEELTIPFKFDMRKRLPGQVARWLESLAGKLATAAERVRQVEDNRSLSLMRRIVSEDGLAETISKEDLRISYDGKQFVSRDEY